MGDDLVGLAFAAGLVAALNPCGFAMLPGYLTLVVRGEKDAWSGATPQESIDIALTLDAIRESAKAGGWVQVGD